MGVDKAKIAALCAETKARREAARGGVGVPPAGDGEGDGDPKRLTRWIGNSEKEPSGYAGGAKIRGDAWLLAECAAMRKRGRKVSVVRHPTHPGFAALYLD